MKFFFLQNFPNFSLSKILKVYYTFNFYSPYSSLLYLDVKGTGEKISDKNRHVGWIICLGLVGADMHNDGIVVQGRTHSAPWHFIITSGLIWNVFEAVPQTWNWVTSHSRWKSLYYIALCRFDMIKNFCVVWLFPAHVL